jgi:hypothetical protein
MSFSRARPQLLSGEALGAAMRSIGMRLGPLAPGTEPADIEQTLASAVRAALPRDFRALGVVLAWLEVHGARVNVPRLGRFLALLDDPVERALWAAVGRWLGRHDARWRVLASAYRGPRLQLDDAEITALQLARSGEDPRFIGSALCVPSKLLRSRTEDVDDPVLLARRHPAYLQRVAFGPSYRADVWAALSQHPDASAAELARAVGCAYETARAVMRDWKTVTEARAAG